MVSGKNYCMRFQSCPSVQLDGKTSGYFSAVKTVFPGRANETQASEWKLHILVKPLCVYLYIYICVCLCVSVYIPCIYIYIYMCVCMYVCVQMNWPYIYIYISSYHHIISSARYLHVYNSYVDMHVRTHTHRHTDACVCALHTNHTKIYQKQWAEHHVSQKNSIRIIRSKHAWQLWTS